MNIFKLITGNIVKWWQFKVLPILRIDNNSDGKNGVEPADYNVGSGMDAGGVSKKPAMDTVQETAVTKPDMTQAESIMERINREKEEERKKLFEKAQEEARLAAIMNANKVDVDAFIQEGKKAREEELAEQAQSHESSTNSQQDAMSLAEEIIARLNREAAEDEAKKNAEIAAAREKAKETFGV